MVGAVPYLSGMPSSLPPWVRDLSRRDLWLRRLRSVGLGFLLLVDAVYASGGFDGRRRAAAGLPVAMSDTASGVGMLIALLGMTLMVAVAWRQRWPVVLTLVGCAATLVQLGPTAALIGLMSVVICRPLVDAYRLAPLVVAATFFAVSRDLRWTPRPVSFWGSLFAADGEPVGWFVVVVLTLVLVALFVGIGAWLRTRAQLKTAAVVVAEEREVVSSLADQVSRQAERERLAREIHDGLGHNLSILSVHAGALQAMADASATEAETAAAVPRPATAQMKESAKVVRETAARSVAELHSLLDLLRSSDDPDVAAPTKTLRDVRALIDDSVTAGMPLVATVYVEDGEALDPYIAQAAYRIVQELLTNARKHASTVSVRLSVTGSPAEGHLVIATANHLPPPVGPHGAGAADGGARAGMGLTGIRERVEHYGGDMQAGVDADAAFRVSIRLPWRAPEADSTKGIRWTT
ncbi:histidine kinase [Terrabacter carboxydivorans]|uniref:histidine kinase n=2 Tax=Terrabacter carboxydivorans TaxID=619730 RepID=A0ABP5Y1P8_9MICO